MRKVKQATASVRQVLQGYAFDKNEATDLANKVCAEIYYRILIEIKRPKAVKKGRKG